MTLERAFPALEFSFPVGLETPPDGTDRLFVVEQAGRIHVFENRDDVDTKTLFLDISSIVNFSGERGLLGLAFDPDFVTNRRFYLNYVVRNDCADPDTVLCTKIVRYEASSSDPNVADPTSAFELLDFSQPYGNHNGGAIVFGPDGMLYVAAGDGGSAGDPHGNGQDTSTLLGSILRLDVREGASSLVPADNPLVGDPQAHPLVFHWGLRNPWRITFDRLSGDLLIADVGQNRREEVHRVAAGSPGGLNFGWNACEGTFDFSGACSSLSSTPPVIEYPHDTPDGGHIIVGGYVYRGAAFPELYGAYLYADASTMNVWAWDGESPVDPWNPGNPGVLIANPGIDLSSWGEDAEGELYGVSISTGFVYRLARSGGTGSFPELLSETGLFADVTTLTASPGMIEYEVEAPSWLDSAIKRRWIALPDRSRITFHADEAWHFPVGTAFVKHLSLPLSGGGERRLETRILLRQTDQWYGLAYRWNLQGTDATLLTSAMVEDIDLGGGSVQSWHYPSSNECLSCHTSAGGRVLGARTRQLGKTFDYPQTAEFPGGEVVQIEAWNCAGLFDIDIRDPARFDRVRAVDDFSARRTDRVRSYLATNCEHCHQPLGPAPGELDFRFTNSIGEWNAVDLPVSQGDFGIPDARLIAPGDRHRSMVWLRQSLSDQSTRMSQGTMSPHPQGVALVGNWIDFDAGTIDTDADGVVDSQDGCPSTPDGNQADRDGDGVGDLCDPDDLPDLAIQTMTVPSGALVREGDQISIGAAVVNSGIADAGDFPVSFYLSSDPVFDPAHDVPIDGCWIDSLAAGDSSSCQIENAIVPNGVMSGQTEFATFHFVACANRAGISPDGNQTNDCAVSNFPTIVPEPSFLTLQWLGVSALAALARSRRRRGR